MADIKQAYAASSNLTIGLASLPTSASFLTGRESTEFDNGTTVKYLDLLVGGKIRVGTSPTINTEIRVYLVAPFNDTTYPDVFDGTDSAETVTSAGVGGSFLKLIAVMAVDSTTSARDYPFGPVSVAQQFGGVVPKKFVGFVTQNTGVDLDSTGANHVISVTPIFETV